MLLRVEHQGIAEQSCVTFQKALSDICNGRVIMAVKAN